MTTPLTPSIEEMERLEKAFLAHWDDETDEPGAFNNHDFKFFHAVRSFIPSAIAVLREKDREIEELREAVKNALRKLSDTGDIGPIEICAMHDVLGAAKGTKP